MPIWHIRSSARRRTKTYTRAALRLHWRNPPTPLVRGALEVLSLSPCGFQKFPPDKGARGGSIPDNKSLAEKARQNRKNPTPAEPMGWTRACKTNAAVTNDLDGAHHNVARRQDRHTNANRSRSSKVFKSVTPGLTPDQVRGRLRNPSAPDRSRLLPAENPLDSGLRRSDVKIRPSLIRPGSYTRCVSRYSMTASTSKACCDTNSAPRPEAPNAAR